MFPMYPEFQGKTVLITGGASGMGRQTALDFAACGANVAVVTRRSEQAAKDTVAQIQSLGGQGIYVLADISVEDDAQRMVQATLDAFGRLDIASTTLGSVLMGPPSSASPSTRCLPRIGTWYATPTSVASSSVSNMSCSR